MFYCLTPNIEDHNSKTTYGRKLPHVSNFIQPKCMIKGKEMETFIPAKTNVDLAAKNGRLPQL
jgi:hypothetical protein